MGHKESNKTNKTRITKCLYISMTVTKILPHPPDPLVGNRGQIFKFHTNSLSCQYFLMKFGMQAEVQ